MSVEPILYAEGESNVIEEKLYKLRITFGASVITSYRGAVHNTTVARNSAGNYTVTLPTTYNEISDFDIGWLKVTGAILQGCIVSQTVQTNGQFIFEIRNSSGTATDPATGDIAYVDIGVSKAGLNDKFVGP